MGSNENSSFKIFVSNSIIDLGKFWVVITGHKYDSEKIETEWYYCNYNTKADIQGALRISSEYFKSIDDFWEKETLSNVKNALHYNVAHERIEDLFSETKDYRLYSIPIEIDLSEVPDEVIIQINSVNSNFIEYIKRTTTCSSIKEYIDRVSRFRIDYQNI